MKYQYYRGEKSYNGVAILSKLNLKILSYIDYCKKETLDIFLLNLKMIVELHNFYVPAGGDEA